VLAGAVGWIQFNWNVFLAGAVFGPLFAPSAAHWESADLPAKQDTGAAIRAEAKQLSLSARVARASLRPGRATIADIRALVRTLESGRPIQVVPLTHRPSHLLVR
jgi:hypothetical protein